MAVRSPFFAKKGRRGIRLVLCDVFVADANGLTMYIVLRMEGHPWPLGGHEI